MTIKISRRKLLAGAAVTAAAAGLVVLDQRTATNPEWPALRTGESVPHPPQAGDTRFARAPVAPGFNERRKLYLDFAAARPTSEERGGIFTDLVKLEAGTIDTISEPALQAALDFVNAREDTADFTLNGLVRLYYRYQGSGKLTRDQETGIHQAMVNFKYWLDEPNPTNMELWTENHQILAWSSEYLAGQLFPDEVFPNNGQTGRWHMEHATQKILRWIDWRARTGMAEWDSVVYYNMDFSALLNLVDFAEDDLISRRATMMVDLLFFDIAVDSFYGQYGTSHGRAAAYHVKSAAGDSIVTLQALAWGYGRFQGLGMSEAALVTSSYSLPQVIEELARDMPSEMQNFERHSIPITDEAAQKYGLSFSDEKDVEIWWAMGAFTHPKVIDLTIRTADQWDLWHYPDFRDLKDLAKVLQSVGLLGFASSLLNPDSNGAIMSEVNKVTYRTPDCMLSSAQDYRKGEKGYQQHIWQATLGPYAVVFVTNPDGLKEDDSQRPSYWASQGRFPRTGQHRSVLVSIYNIDRHPSPKPLESRHYGFTHAYFPRWAFDEVREVAAVSGGGWIFGSKGDGYVALYSHQPYQWQTEGPDTGQEVIALGLQNVWLCQVGRKAVNISFDYFVKSIATSRVEVNGLQVKYFAPGVGEVSYGWDGPLMVDGKEIATRDYPRWKNPYTTAEFNTGKVELKFGGHLLVLDFNKGERIVG